MSSEPTAAEKFENERYLFVNSLLSHPLLSIAYLYTMKMYRSGTLLTSPEFQELKNTPAKYCDLLMNSIQDVIKPLLEEGIGIKLFPSFTYLRVYQPGDSLAPHTDRPSGEISITLNLGCSSEKAWPIFLEVNGTNHEVVMQPGDALIYHGIESSHWREEFTGEHHTQLTLHYVDQNGPYTEHRFDEAYHRSKGVLQGDLEIMSI